MLDQGSTPSVLLNATGFITLGFYLLEFNSGFKGGALR